MSALYLTPFFLDHCRSMKHHLICLHCGVFIPKFSSATTFIHQKDEDQTLPLCVICQKRSLTSLLTESPLDWIISNSYAILQTAPAAAWLKEEFLDLHWNHFREAVASLSAFSRTRVKCPTWLDFYPFLGVTITKSEELEKFVHAVELLQVSLTDLGFLRDDCHIVSRDDLLADVREFFSLNNHVNLKRSNLSLPLPLSSSPEKKAKNQESVSSSPSESHMLLVTFPLTHSQRNKLNDFFETFMLDRAIQMEWRFIPSSLPQSSCVDLPENMILLLQHLCKELPIELDFLATENRVSIVRVFE